jgi:hypothetical protein
MSSESSRLLEQLRHSIVNSLGSVETLELLSALSASGHRVSVSIDVTIDEPEPLSNNESAASYISNPLLLTQSDELFLEAMHISAGSEVDSSHKAN